MSGLQYTRRWGRPWRLCSSVDWKQQQKAPTTVWCDEYESKLIIYNNNIDNREFDWRKRQKDKGHHSTTAPYLQLPRTAASASKINKKSPTSAVDFLFFFFSFLAFSLASVCGNWVNGASGWLALTYANRARKSCASNYIDAKGCDEVAPPRKAPSGYHIFYPNNHHTKLHERWYFIVARELCKLARVTGPEFPHPFSPVRRLVSVLGGKCA